MLLVCSYIYLLVLAHEECNHAHVRSSLERGCERGGGRRSEGGWMLLNRTVPLIIDFGFLMCSLILLSMILMLSPALVHVVLSR